jgi:hypothetical protein
VAQWSPPCSYSRPKFADMKTEKAPQNYKVLQKIGVCDFFTAQFKDFSLRI